ncbi:MAG TPA: cell division protein ZipA C-terminal FtsZ-binding domain-containing protein [Burkholderiales bacterium]|nr:cell division protein ZipA C-terminal FtsZ-binding domain-containing protein [Burkholderiales bacterium]
MSELQIGLAIVGALVIAGVMAYNRIQENRLRKRAEASLLGPPGDALLETAGGRHRIEPQLKSAEAEAASVPAGRVEPVGLSAPAPAQPAEDAGRIDYVIAVESQRPVQRQALTELVDLLAGVARPTSVTVSADDGLWVAAAAAPATVSRLHVALQLADRRGPLTEEDLVSFRTLVTQWAQGVNATVNAPEPGPYVQTARELDQFCADADVAIGLNIVAAGSGTLSGTKLRGCLEAAGMRFDRGAYRLLDAQGWPLFSVERQGGGALDPDQLKTTAITGVTLVLDVPRVAQGLKIFDQMVDASKQLSTALGGSLVDDNRAPVTEAGLEQIRDQLRRIYAAMDARGIPAGSSTALRLFS